MRHLHQMPTLPQLLSGSVWAACIHDVINFTTIEIKVLVASSPTKVHLLQYCWFCINLPIHLLLHFTIACKK